MTKFFTGLATLLVGAVLGYFAHIDQTAAAAVMGFGCGVMVFAAGQMIFEEECDHER